MRKINNDLIFRDYQKGDEYGIIELMCPHWKHFSCRDARLFWQWEYANCPSGQALVQVAEHRGKIIGHYALLPLEIKCGNDILAGAKAEGSIVHPDYRGANIKRFFPDNKSIRIFDSLIKRAFERAHEHNIDLIYGFPLENALKSQVKAGYYLMSEKMATLMLPLNFTKTLDFILFERIKNANVRYTTSKLVGPIYRTWALNKQSKMSKKSSDVNVVEQYSELGDEIDDLWTRYSKAENCITLKRDKKYLQWRFLNDPVIKHKIFVSRHGRKITGYIAVSLSRCYGRYLIGNVVDFICLRNRQLDGYFLVREAISFFKKCNTDFVKVWLSESAFKFWHTAFSDNGFYCLSIANLDVIVKPSNILNLKQVLDGNNWFITMAFTEGVS